MRDHPIIVVLAQDALQAVSPAMPIRPGEPFLSHCKQLCPTTCIGCRVDQRKAIGGSSPELVRATHDVTRVLEKVAGEA